MAWAARPPQRSPPRGRSPRPIVGPMARATARSITFSSSLTLPGKLYASSARSASAERARISFPCSAVQRERKVLRQQADVLASLAQGRNLLDADDVQPVVEIPPEGTRAHVLLHVAVRRREDAHVDRDLAAPIRRRGPSAPARRGAASPAAATEARPPRRGAPSPRRRRGEIPPRLTTAPVNAPRSCPKSSASMSASGMAPQLTTRNGLSRRSPASWSARAIRSLPVPLSPVISTVVRALAMRRIMSPTRRIASDWPSRSRCCSRPSWALSRSFSVTMARFSMRLVDECPELALRRERLRQRSRRRLASSPRWPSPRRRVRSSR